MKRLPLKVDSKGRIQVPKGLREELGIEKQVSARIENGAMTIEPTQRLFDKLANEVRFNFKSISSDMPKLRKAAEDELFKQQ